MTRAAKTFERGEVVEIQRSPSSPFWLEARYLGPYTIDYPHAPWHEVQINADRYAVPTRRIRKRSK